MYRMDALREWSPDKEKGTWAAFLPVLPDSLLLCLRLRLSRISSLSVIRSSAAGVPHTNLSSLIS